MFRQIYQIGEINYGFQGEIPFIVMLRYWLHCIKLM